MRILRQFGLFTDYRNADLIEHPVEELVAQRVYGLALGYEDLNDHEELRNDPLLAVLVEKSDLGNQALAGKSTLNRLELTKRRPVGGALQKDRAGSRSGRPPAGADLSGSLPGGAARNHPGPGCDRRSAARSRKGASHGYYGHYCYLPLYISAESSCCVRGCDRRTSCFGGSRGAAAHRGTDSFRVAPVRTWCAEILDFAARS